MFWVFACFVFASARDVSGREMRWNARAPTPPTPAQVTPDTTVGFAIMKLAATKVHRLYVLDAADRPVGVLSLKDVLRHIVSVAVVGTTPRGAPLEVPHAVAPLEAVTGARK